MLNKKRHINQQLIIRTTPRCIAEKRYTLRVLLEHFLGLDYELLVHDDYADGYAFFPKGGGELFIQDAFFKNENWLDATNLPKKPLVLEHPTAGQAPLIGFYGEAKSEYWNATLSVQLDLIASAFFLLTRWEERVQPQRDAHDRFPSTASFLVQHKLHQTVLLESYADALHQWLRQRGMRQEAKKWSTRLILSCDVDHPQLWPQGTSKTKTLAGSLLKRRDWNEFQYWSRWKSKTDPYDTCGYLMDLAEKKGLPPVEFNFLAAAKGDKDHWYALDNSFVQALFSKIKKRGHLIGLHPSRSSVRKQAQLLEEKKRLEATAQIKISTGRQHYLSFAVPDTWVAWETSGLKMDSSMGYTDRAGFRCGTARPFPVFDVLEKKELKLMEQPLVAMDVAMALHQGLSPKAMEAELYRLKAQVQRFGGDFTLLWHNSSINSYFWAAYKPIIERFILNF